MTRKEIGKRIGAIKEDLENLQKDIESKFKEDSYYTGKSDDERTVIKIKIAKEVLYL